MTQSVKNNCRNKVQFLFLDTDKMFDELLGKTAGNVFVARVVAPLQTHSRRFWYRLRIDDNAIVNSAAVHIELIESIISGDPNKAKKEHCH